METEVQKYADLCRDDPTIPLFSQAWWLDLVAPGSWDVALNWRDNSITAAMPFLKTQRLRWLTSSMPPLTQTLGPWVAATDTSPAARFRHEMQELSTLAAKLPEFHKFSQRWHHSITNWLPFYWAGYEQTTRYTYRLKGIRDTDKIWAGMAGKTRTEIRKASDRHHLAVDVNPSIREFTALNSMVFERQGATVPYSASLVESIASAARRRNAMDLVIVRDDLGVPHAGALIVRDQTTGYYLLGGSDPNLRNSGAASLALWEALQLCAKYVDNFDFEGSMMQNIEPFVRNFGSTQTPYFQVSRTKSRSLQLVDSLRKLR